MDRQRQINQYIQQDAFTYHLGAKVEAIGPGYSRVSLAITAEMTNFHGITHGGVVFSLGDIAFAAASNARGQTAVALSMSISFLRATQVGDHLVAECREKHQGGPIALYDITVTEQASGELVAQSQAMVYRKKEWFVLPETQSGSSGV